MKTIALSLCLTLTAPAVFAALCSTTPVGRPCTPDPGVQTSERKAEIIQLIADAKAQERAEKERRDNAAWAEIEAAAAACGYKVSYQGTTGKFLGFQGENEYLYFKESAKTEIRMNDIKIMLLVGRSCHDVDHYPDRATVPACNGAAPLLAANAGQSGFSEKLDYLFRDRSGCIGAVLDNAGAITDSAALDKVIASHKKIKIAEKRDYERRYPRTPDVKPPSGGGSNPPAGGGGDNNYIWDPGCGCWIRRQ